MDDMAERYADRGVTSVFIYTREAHPGENLPHHTSQELKRAHARAFESECSVGRRILLDDLEGTAHQAFGLLPNMSWILARGGLILYKAAWTHARDLENALEDSLAALAMRRSRPLTPAYTERLLWRIRDEDAFRAGLERAGPQAVKDFYG
jgi:hypothetical protein